MSNAAKQQIKDYIMTEFLPGESPDELTDSTPLISGGILENHDHHRVVSRSRSLSWSKVRNLASPLAARASDAR